MTASRLLPSLSLLVFLCLPSFSQQNITDYINKSDKDFFDGAFMESDVQNIPKSAIKDGTVTRSNLTPKRIGLASIYLFEKSYMRRKAHLTYIYSLEGQQNYFFHNIGPKAMEGLVQAFEGSPFELVFPADYLDSDAKHAAFATAIERINGLDHPFLDQMKQWKLQPSGNEQPFLYTWIEEGTNGFVADEMATLAKSLGLDALLTVQLSTLYQTQTISFFSIEFILHGVNPAAQEGQQGLVLGRYSLFAGYPYPFVYIRNGKPSQERFGAYGRITERTMRNFLDFTQLELNELF